MRAKDFLIESRWPTLDLDKFNSIEEIELAVKDDPEWQKYFKYFGWPDPFNNVPGEDYNSVTRLFHGPIEKWHYSFYNVPQIIIKGSHRGQPDRTMLKYDLNGNEVTEKNEYSDNYMIFPIVKRNIEDWLKKDLERVKKDLDKLEGRFYIRFGKWSKNERSKNHLASAHGEDVFEKGVSVYNASWSMKDRKWDIEPDVNYDTIAGTMSELFHSDMPVYVVTGDELNSLGSDGEPLLRNVKIKQKLTKKDIQVPGIFDSEDD